ncbi:FAD-binding oxidoreductase [soil metagenome]
MAITTTIRPDGTLDSFAVEALRSSMRGSVLLPDDPGYDSARAIWNAMIDRRPAVIARCVSTADVIAAVNFAREHNLPVSIRGGGHNVSGRAVGDGALMIDLSPMKGIRVDPDAMTAQAEAGVLWGEYDRETQAFGLATPGGTVATTGIAGLTLGGGQNWLMGKYGFTIDNLLSVDLVTADGKLLHASQHENPDLFWALRGAGHNFGVATSFEYRLHSVGPEVLGGMVIHPIDRAEEVLRFYREFTASEPDELTTFAGFLTGPDGNAVVALLACYAGDLEAGERAIAPLREFGPPVADTLGPMTYLDVQGILTAAFPYGRHNYWKSSLLNEISDEVIEVVSDFARRMPSPYTAIAIIDCHGAYSRVGKTETAYYHRDQQYDIVAAAAWTDPDDTEKNIGWARDLYDAIEPLVPRAAYVNDIDDDEGTERVRHAYGENYERLARLKARYDPTNFFRLNQNITPRT